MAEPAGPEPSAEAHFAPAERATLRRLLTSSALSKIADWQLGIVVPLVVLTESRSVSASLLTFALRALAYAVSPLIGSVVDRFDRSAVFIAAQFQQALCLAVVAFTPDNLSVLSVMLLLSGFGGVASSIAGQFVLVPQLFSRTERPHAAARLGAVIEYSRAFGMLVGGLTVSVSGPTFALACTALCYAAAGCIAHGLPRARPGPSRSTLKADLVIGLAWLRRPEIFWLVTSLSLMNLASGQIEIVLVTLFEQYGLVALVSSLILTAGSLLSGAANRLASRLLPRSTPERRILACQSLHVVSLAVLCIPGIGAKVVGYALHAFATGAINVTSIVYRQNVIPIDIAGRVNSTMRMFIAGSIPLSAAVYAAAGHMRPALYWVPGLVLMAGAVLVWVVWVLRLRKAGASVKGQQATASQRVGQEGKVTE
ncbi:MULTISPECIES: MFS transporter [Streptomyces]|uniref:MFS transporter n=2 Tax=Streptomyces TaxID=1883 RepID=A0ABV9IWL6_9ACTN